MHGTSSKHILYLNSMYLNLASSIAQAAQVGLITDRLFVGVILEGLPRQGRSLNVSVWAAVTVLRGACEDPCQRPVRHEIHVCR